jgi:CRP-like cAMP-binding protein
MRSEVRAFLSPRTRNLLLASLSDSNRDLLLKQCTAVPLPLRTSLYEPEVTPDYAYFMTSGFASMVATSPNGDTAEVGIVGREGLVGGFHLLGPSNAPTECFIQLAGTGLRIRMADLRQAFLTSPEIRGRVLECVQSQGLTLSQIAGCHRFHGAEERLARWLLMAQDRAQSDNLELTQEFLGMMLGARRTTVTVVAGVLQRSGLIEYNRGIVTVPQSNKPHQCCLRLLPNRQGALRHPLHRQGLNPLVCEAVTVYVSTG